MSKTSSDAPAADHDTPTRIAPLFELLADSSSVAIVCHDDPDPDCLASAYALEHLARREGVAETQLVYGGEISHRQNRAMVDRLGLELSEYAPGTLDAHELVAFVDQSVPGQHNPVSETTELDIVIDHHPSDEVRGRYVDSRPARGATATMLAEYYRTRGIAPTPRVATGLLFGIRRETLEFLRRSTTLAEYEAAQFLHPYADADLVQALSESLFSPRTLDAIAAAIGGRRRHRSTLVAGTGRTADREPIPLAADYLLNLAGVDTTAVYGVVGDALEVSARTQHPRVHVGRQLAGAFEVGSAGGHRTMAGASVPLDALAADLGARHLDGVVAGLERRLLEHLGSPG